MNLMVKSLDRELLYLPKLTYKMTNLLSVLTKESCFWWVSLFVGEIVSGYFRGRHMDCPPSELPPETKLLLYSPPSYWISLDST